MFSTLQVSSTTAANASIGFNGRLGPNAGTIRGASNRL